LPRFPLRNIGRPVHKTSIQRPQTAVGGAAQLPQNQHAAEQGQKQKILADRVPNACRMFPSRSRGHRAPGWGERIAGRAEASDRMWAAPGRNKTCGIQTHHFPHHMTDPAEPPGNVCDCRKDHADMETNSMVSRRQDWKCSRHACHAPACRAWCRCLIGRVGSPRSRQPPATRHHHAG